MKEKNRYLKMMPVLAVALLLLAGTGFAALLTHYGQITGDVTVDRAINLYENGILMADAEADYTLDRIGGSSYTNELYTATNDAQVPITIDVSISYSPRKTGNIPPEWTSQCDGITATAYESLTKTLVLENKDSNWQPISDGTSATLIYNVLGDTFDYSISAMGLQAATDYSIIYYADKPDRFDADVWGGDNPGALIGTFTTDSVGDYSITTDSINLGINLPSTPDANINGDNYCTETGDNYHTCFGAKIWIVPSTNYDSNLKTVIEWANKANFLFETDLIHYYDTDSGDLTGFGLDSNKMPAGISSNIITVPAGDSADFVVLNEFAPNAISTGCEITVSLDVPIAP